MGLLQVKDLLMSILAQINLAASLERNADRPVRRSFPFKVNSSTN